MSDTVWVAIIGAVIGSIVSPIILGLFNKRLNKNEDGTDLAQKAFTIANQAVDDLAKEKEAGAEKSEKIAVLERKVLVLEDARQGPYRLSLEFYTLPHPRIDKAEIMSIEEQPRV